MSRPDYVEVETMGGTEVVLEGFEAFESVKAAAAMLYGTAPDRAAPQVTPADVEAAIANEHYYTGSEGSYAAWKKTDEMEPPDFTPLRGLMHCALVLKNGHVVTGEALLQDLSKPDPERARASARRRAFDKAYDMVVYAERERLASGVAA